jgi:hypothetical protein
VTGSSSSARPAPATVIALVAWVGATLAGIAGVWLRATGSAPVIPTTFGFGDAAMVTFVVLGSAWAGVGTLLVWRTPDNVIGPFMVVIGVGNAGSVLAAAVTFQAVSQGDSSLAGAAAWWTVVLSSLGQLSLYVAFIFPTGRGPTRGWDRVAKMLLAGMALVLVWLMTRPGTLHLFHDLANPLGIGPDLRSVLGPTPEGPIALFSIVLAPLLVGSVITRYRRSGAIERMQVKWVLSALVLSVAGAVTLTTTVDNAVAPGAPLVAYSLTSTLVPLAIGSAILRYRLYEIDRVISRTVSWAVVTVVLAGVFTAGVVGLQAVLTGVTQGQTLAVAASTLAAFALFQPVRRRVQRVVDRRFDRARYDAELTARAFAGRLRDDSAVEAVESDLRRVVADSLNPSSVSLWLRGSGS